MSQQQHAVPVFPAKIEAKAMESLNAVMVFYQGSQRPVDERHMLDLNQAIAKLVDCLFPVNGNVADFASEGALPGGHYVHPIKVAEVAALMGRTMGLPRSRLIHVATAAALMNIGYFALKQSLIDQPRRLLEGEWEGQIAAHPAYSVTALGASGVPHDVIVAVGQHHERWDGSGYPHGIRGEEICLEARLIAIADTYIAMRSHRPYRAPLNVRDAVEAIASHAGELFEPALVDVLAGVIAEFQEKDTKVANAAQGVAAAAEEASARSKQAEAARQQEAWTPALRDEDAREEEKALRTAAEGRSRQRGTPPPFPVAATIPAPVPAPAGIEASGGVAPAPRSRTATSARRRGRRSMFGAGLYVRGASSGEWLER